MHYFAVVLRSLVIESGRGGDLDGCAEGYFIRAEKHCHRLLE